MNESNDNQANDRTTDEQPSKPALSRRKALSVLGPAGFAIGGFARGRLDSSTSDVFLPTGGGGGRSNSASSDSPKSEKKTEDEGVDSPEGFGVEVLAPHANFPDDVAAKFEIEYDEGYAGTVVSDLPRDASTVIVAKVTWEPEGTSGWHTHPGPVIVTITEGELELINERDCVPRTYTAGEAFIDPGQGNIHTAANPSETEPAVAYATFLGVPDGGPATVWVAPVECEGGDSAVGETDDEDDIYQGPGDDDDGDDADNDGDGYADEDDEDKDDDGDSDGNNRDDDDDGAIDEDGDWDG